jgi:hypothetical protein
MKEDPAILMSKSNWLLNEALKKYEKKVKK